MNKKIDHEIELSLVRDDLPFRLQQRVGLIPKNGLGILRRAIFFALITWLPLVLWALFNGRVFPGQVDEPLLQHFGIHVRFLIAVPLMIMGEAMMHKLMVRLIPYFQQSGLIQDEQQGAFKEIIQGVIRLRNLTKPWLITVVLILAWTIFRPAAPDEHELNWAAGGFGGFWFRYVSRPIFTILLAGWLWRLTLLVILLKRIAGIGLNLVPTHADRAGGLGFLEKLPTAFSLFALAVSSVLASQLAHEVVYHGVHVQSLKGLLVAFLIVVIGLCITPLLVFIGPLAAAKRQALLEYGTLVGQHGRQVRRRWILGEKLDDDSLLDAQEIGPVADTLALYDAVKNMRIAPIGKSAIMGVALPALIPLLILLSIEVPIKDVLTKLLGILV
jgi:hypothetical protein